MAKLGNEEIDLAECGGIKPLQIQDTEIIFEGNPSVSDAQQLTGRTGSAHLRQNATELRFFPACERPLFMVLEYLSSKVWELQGKLEQLELRNRQANGSDYKEHQPDNEYGKQKEALMKELINQINDYLKIFNNANGVLGQPAPGVQSVNRYKTWASHHLSPDPAGGHHAADNYRFVGPRPSSIDASFHAFLDYMSGIWPFRRDRRDSTKRSSGLGERHGTDENGNGNEGEEEEEEGGGGGIIIVKHSNALFRAVSNAVMVCFAFVFLLLPPTMVCLVDMSELVSVLVMVAFCLSFFLVIVFFFGALNTEHKFLLFFAYCGAMVTMLSSIGKNNVTISIPGLTHI